MRENSSNASWLPQVRRGLFLTFGVLFFMATPLHANTQVPAPAAHDGQHDFDFEIGTWKTHLRRLQHPLTGSTTWVQYDGTSVIRKIWDGRANMVELEVDGPAGHIQGLSLRLYNPQSHQWSLNFASSRSGTIGTPIVGEFTNGRGEFFDQEDFNGRMIFVRNAFVDITANSYRFEQSFSNDGGKTWETNWIATDTRIPDSANAASGASGRQKLEDAWWTGPMLAPSAATLARGHFLVEPYLYDVIATGSQSNGFGSLTYALIGLTDKITVGLIPTAGFNKLSAGSGSSAIGRGDLTSQIQYGLTKFHEGSWLPTTSVALQETFPTGRYDDLGNRPGSGLGSGAYSTTVAVYSQKYFWLPNRRILRMRFNVEEAFSTTANVSGASVYGTSDGFRGEAKPGASTYVDASWEYSLTRRWVLALDATYRHDANTRVTGDSFGDAPYDAFGSVPGEGHAAPGRPGITMNSGSSEAFGFAPAIEYSWKRNIGVLLGTRIIALGRNTPVTITPAVAINYWR